MDCNCNVVTCEEEAVNNREGNSGAHIFIVDIFGRGAHFVEGSSGVVHCTVGNEQEDCIIVKDTGVGSVKGMSMFDSPL